MKKQFLISSFFLLASATADNGLMNIKAGPTNQELNKSMQDAQISLQQKALAAQVTAQPQQQQQNRPTQVMMIDPTIRAGDYKQAFDYLKKEKAGAAVSFELTSGEKISNIMEITLMPGGSLLIFRLNTSSGVSYRVVKIEDIASVGQS